MNILFALLGAGSGGVLIAIGAAANARLRQTLQSSIAAAAINFIIGFTTLALLMILQVLPIPPLEYLLTVPWWAFLGGFLGAAFVTLSTLVVPKLGLTTTTLAVVCTQMIVSVIIDQLGWLSIAPRPISASKIVAIGLFILAIALTQLDRESHQQPQAIIPKID
ncbi:DMT family transporter [Calothrix membranacea FACHB-236]|nr:DMT family transporter [Calothrix membranacea FACHB-236]